MTETPVELESTSTTKLGDWYAGEFSNSRQQLILCVSEKGRLPLVLPATPYKTFPQRLPEFLSQLLRQIGIAEDQISLELSQMKEVRLDKTINRSIVGTLKRYQEDLEYKLQYGPQRLETMLECSLWLANGISMQLEEKVPADAVKNLFASQH